MRAWRCADQWLRSFVRSFVRSLVGLFVPRVAVAECAEGGVKNRHQIIIPKLSRYFTGTGDLIAAVFLAWYHKEPEAMPHAAAEKAVATVVR